MPLKIFVSYNTSDREHVKALIDDLEALDHGTWFDQEVTGGQAWWEMILSQVQECDLFLIALTPNMLASPWCGLEYTYAFALNKRILPVLLIDTDLRQLPPELSRIQFVDYRAADKRAFAALRKAIDLLPPALPLPDPLPTPPERFVSAIGRLRERINTAALTFEEQAAILLDLKGRLDSPEDADAAHELLRIFQHRDDLLARISREIDALLGTKLAPSRVEVVTPPVQQAAVSASIPNNDPAIDYYKQFKLIRTITGHTAGVRGCDFNPDASVIVSGCYDNSLKLWDVQTGREIRTFKGHTSHVDDCVFSPDGSLITSAGSLEREVRLWDAVSGSPSPVYTFSMPTRATAVAFSPDGQYILAALGNHTLQLWNVAGTLIREMKGHTNALEGCAFSSDGAMIASSSYDATVRIWGAATGEIRHVLKGHGTSTFGSKGVGACMFSPDGTTLVSCSSDKTLKLWDVATGKEIRTFKGHTHWVWHCVFSPDGRVIASASSDNTIRFWDTATGRQIHQLNGHTDNVYRVRFSRDGRYLVSASKDKTLKLWGVE